MVGLRRVVYGGCSIAFAMTTSILGTACKSEAPANQTDAKSDVPTAIGNLAWVSSERADAPLSQIERLTVDAKQRVFAPDFKESAVFVYGADGVFLKKIGRKGSGPGEFDRGCCAAIDGHGRLWIKDTGNSRYVVFTVTDAGTSVDAKPAFVVPVPHSDRNWGPRLWFDAKDHMISIGHATDANNPDKRVVKRFIADTTGQVLQTIEELPQTEDVTKPVEFRSVDGPNTSVEYLYQPFGAGALRADGPNGTFALAGAGKYSVRWFSPTGELLHTLVQDVSGPELSAQDRLAGDSSLLQIARQGHTTVAQLPFKLPERRPPLYNIFFDADGRLWVQRTTLKGQVQNADVYATDGSLAFHAAWPAGIAIANNGFVRGHTAWGVQLDENDVPHIVRMEFNGGR